MKSSVCACTGQGSDRLKLGKIFEDLVHVVAQVALVYDLGNKFKGRGCLH